MKHVGKRAAAGAAPAIVGTEGLFDNTSIVASAASRTFEKGAEFLVGDTTPIPVTPEITRASLTLTDGFEFNFYVDNLEDATGYTIKFEGECAEDGQTVALKEAEDGKIFATASVYPKNIKEKITATLYKGTEEIGTTKSSTKQHRVRASLTKSPISSLNFQTRTATASPMRSTRRTFSSTPRSKAQRAVQAGMMCSTANLSRQHNRFHPNTQGNAPNRFISDRGISDWEDSVRIFKTA